MDVEWQWCDLAELPLQRLYAVFAAYLQRFYGGFGFVVASPPYIEDGIAHVEMLRGREKKNPHP